MFWKTGQERKAGRKPDAPDAIFRSTMTIDNFSRRDVSVLRDMVEIESEFGIVTNWDFDKSGLWTDGPARFRASGKSGADSFRKTIENLI